MKPEELRLGNFVDYGSITCEVISISKSQVVLKTDKSIYKVKPEDLSPVLLHNHWLIKFGWVWSDKCKCYERLPDFDARMFLQFRDVNSSYTMFNYVLNATICDRIYYVHQLQNLYFDIKKKEL